MTFEEWWKQVRPADSDYLKPYFEETWETATKLEREECAKICDHYSEGARENMADICADMIRARHYGNN